MSIPSDPYCSMSDILLSLTQQSVSGLGLSATANIEKLSVVKITESSVIALGDISST